MQAPPKLGERWLCATTNYYQREDGEGEETSFAEIKAVHNSSLGLAKSHYDVQDLSEEAELEEKKELSRSTN